MPHYNGLIGQGSSAKGGAPVRIQDIHIIFEHLCMVSVVDPSPDNWEVRVVMS